jgi:phosphoribosylamine-glycine ligase
MNKVLLVDTGFSSMPIYNYLSSLGYEVHVIGLNPADCLAKIAKTYHQIDYSDSEKLAKIIIEKDYGYVVPGCTDVSYKTCAKLRPLFNFINTDSPLVTDILLQKKYFRQFCRKNDLPVPKLVDSLAKTKSELIVVKPVDAYSGRGIAILRPGQENEINEAIATAKSASTCGDYLIEEHVAGQLYSHSAFIAAKKIVFDVVVEEHGSANKFAVDTSWVVHDFPTCYLIKIRESIEKITMTA